MRVAFKIQIFPLPLYPSLAFLSRPIYTGIVPMKVRKWEYVEPHSCELSAKARSDIDRIHKKKKKLLKKVKHDR